MTYKRTKRRRPATTYTRKIWVDANGPIPFDENGLRFDIHHRDGDPFNNEITNLQALSLADHYAAHVARGEWNAAWCIAKRMRKDEMDARRAEVSNALRGKSHNWGWKITIGLTGKKLTPEHRKNLSLSHMGNKPSAETRAKMSAARRGRPQSPELNKRRSNKLKGRIVSPETRAKISANQKGKPRWPNGRSPETIAKMKATLAAKFGRAVQPGAS